MTKTGPGVISRHSRSSGNSFLKFPPRRQVGPSLWMAFSGVTSFERSHRGRQAVIPAKLVPAKAGSGNPSQRIEQAARCCAPLALICGNSVSSVLMHSQTRTETDPVFFPRRNRSQEGRARQWSISRRRASMGCDIAGTPALLASGRLEPAQTSGAGSPARTAVLISAWWIPPPQRVRCPPKRNQTTHVPMTRLSARRYDIRVQSSKFLSGSDCNPRIRSGLSNLAFLRPAHPRPAGGPVNTIR